MGTQRISRKNRYSVRSKFDLKAARQQNIADEPKRLARWYPTRLGALHRLQGRGAAPRQNRLRLSGGRRFERTAALGGQDAPLCLAFELLLEGLRAERLAFLDGGGDVLELVGCDA